jgi:hypothetical protein
MRFGLKGLDAPVIIGIVVAVIAAAIILFILWQKGVLPIGGAITDAECATYFTQGCGNGMILNDIIKNSGCKSFGISNFGRTETEACFPTIGTPANCQAFCDKVLGTST